MEIDKSNTIQTTIQEGATLQSVHGGDTNITTYIQDVPQVQTVIRDNVATVASIINAPFIEVTSVNGMTGDVITEPIMLDFIPNHYYPKNTIINYDGNMYWAKNTFTSGDTIDLDDWYELSSSVAVNDATLTIQRNGVDMGTFTANASVDKSINVLINELICTSDLRNSMKPVNALARKTTTHFTSFGGLNGSTNDGKFADAMLYNTWNDYTGGRVNSLVFSKTGDQSLWHYTGDFGADTWSGAKRIAYADEIASLDKLDKTAVRLVPTKAIDANSDLNTVDFVKVGNYFISTNVGARTLTNCPAQEAFRMEVYSASQDAYDNETTGTWVYRWRKIVDISGNIWYQNCSTSAVNQWTYGPWLKAPKMSDLPTLTSQLTNDSNFVVDINYVHTDNNYTDDDKATVEEISDDGTVSGSGKVVGLQKTLSGSRMTYSMDGDTTQWGGGGGKNLLNWKGGIGEQGWLGANTTYSIDGDTLTVSGAWFAGFFLPTKRNTDYYVSATRSNLATSGAGRIGIYTISHTNITTFAADENGTFNSGNNTGVIVLFYSSAGTAGGSATFSDIQVEEGTAQTSYEPRFVVGKNLCKLVPVETPNYGISATYDDMTGLAKLYGVGTETWSNPFKNSNALGLSCPFLPGHTYTMSIDTPIQLRTYCSLHFTNGTRFDNAIQAGQTEYTFTVPNDGRTPDWYWVWFSSTSGTDVNDISFRFQVEEGSVATPFEPYFNEEPAPYPDNEAKIWTAKEQQTIKTIGKNLLNPAKSKNALIQRDSVIIDPTYYSVALTTDWIPCEPNTNYTISWHNSDTRPADRRHRWLIKNKDGSVELQGSEIIVDGTHTILTGNNAEFMRVYYYYDYEHGGQSGYVVNPLDITGVQVEKGDTTTEYEPYQEKNFDIDLGVGTTESDNLYKWSDFYDRIKNHSISASNGSVVLDESGMYYTGATAVDQYFKIDDKTLDTGQKDLLGFTNLKPNTTYTLSWTATNYSQALVAVWNADDTVRTLYASPHNGPGRANYTFTTGANVSWYTIRFDNEAYSYHRAVVENNITNIVLVEGSTPAEPIELCKLSDECQDYIYRANNGWYIHKAVGSITPTGDESGWLVDAGSNSTSYYYARTNAFDSLVQSNEYTGYCNRFINKGTYILGSDTVSNDMYSFGGDSYTLRFMILGSRLSGGTTTALRTWLANNPTTIYYPAKTPQDIKITNSVIINQLEKLGAEALYLDGTNLVVGAIGQSVSLNTTANTKGYNGIRNAITDKQDKLISGVNIKTINGESLLGAGNISLVTTEQMDEAIQDAIAGITDYENASF